MPRKFKRVLRKRYSKSKAEKCGHDDDADHSEKEESVSLITTGSISKLSTQEDLCASHTRGETDPIKNTADASTQTDSTISTTTCTVSTQTEDSAVTIHPTSQISHRFLGVNGRWARQTIIPRFMNS